MLSSFKCNVFTIRKHDFRLSNRYWIKKQIKSLLDKETRASILRHDCFENFDKLLGADIVGQRPQAFAGAAGKQDNIHAISFSTLGAHRVMQEVHNLLQGLLSFILTGYILKGNSGFLLHINLRITLSNAHGTATLAHLTEQEA